MSQSPIDEIRQLESRRAVLISKAKDAALAEIHEQISILAELGFDYSLAADMQLKSRSRISKALTGPRGPCPICKFATNPPHDRRQHKSQSQKLAFSPDELRSKGLIRIDADVVQAVEDDDAGNAPNWPEPLAQ